MNSKLRSRIVLNLLKTLHEYYENYGYLQDDIRSLILSVFQRLNPEEAIKFYQDISRNINPYEFSVIQHMPDDVVKAVIQYICDHPCLLNEECIGIVMLIEDDLKLFENTDDDTAQKLKIIKDVLQSNINKNTEQLVEEERIGYYLNIISELRTKIKFFKELIDILNSK